MAVNGAETGLFRAWNFQPAARMKKTNTLESESGQGLTEYLMIMILVAVVSIAAVKSLGTTVKQKIQEARQHINEDITLKEGS